MASSPGEGEPSVEDLLKYAKDEFKQVMIDASRDIRKHATRIDTMVLQRGTAADERALQVIEAALSSIREIPNTVSQSLQELQTRLKTAYGNLQQSTNDAETTKDKLTQKYEELEEQYQAKTTELENQTRERMDELERKEQNTLAALDKADHDFERYNTAMEALKALQTSVEQAETERTARLQLLQTERDEVDEELSSVKLQLSAFQQTTGDAANAADAAVEAARIQGKIEAQQELQQYRDDKTQEINQERRTMQARIDLLDTDIISGVVQRTRLEEQAQLLGSHIARLEQRLAGHRAKMQTALTQQSEEMTKRHVEETQSAMRDVQQHLLTYGTKFDQAVEHLRSENSKFFADAGDDLAKRRQDFTKSMMEILNPVIQKYTDSLIEGIQARETAVANQEEIINKHLAKVSHLAEGAQVQHGILKQARKHFESELDTLKGITSSTSTISDSWEKILAEHEKKCMENTEMAKVIKDANEDIQKAKEYIRNKQDHIDARNRAEAEAAAASSTNDRLKAELRALQQGLKKAEMDLATLQGTHKQLQDDRDYWRKRAESCEKKRRDDETQRITGFGSVFKKLAPSTSSVTRTSQPPQFSQPSQIGQTSSISSQPTSFPQSSITPGTGDVPQLPPLLNPITPRDTTSTRPSVYDINFDDPTSTEGSEARPSTAIRFGQTPGTTNLTTISPEENESQIDIIEALGTTHPDDQLAGQYRERSGSTSSKRTRESSESQSTARLDPKIAKTDDITTAGESSRVAGRQGSVSQMMGKVVPIGRMRSIIGLRPQSSSSLAPQPQSGEVLQGGTAPAIRSETFVGGQGFRFGSLRLRPSTATSSAVTTDTRPSQTTAQTQSTQVIGETQSTPTVGETQPTQTTESGQITNLPNVSQLSLQSPADLLERPVRLGGELITPFSIDSRFRALNDGRDRILQAIRFPDDWDNRRHLHITEDMSRAVDGRRLHQTLHTAATGGRNPVSPRPCARDAIVSRRGASITQDNVQYRCSTCKKDNRTCWGLNFTQEEFKDTTTKRTESTTSKVSKKSKKSAKESKEVPEFDVDEEGFRYTLFERKPDPDDDEATAT